MTRNLLAELLGNYVLGNAEQRPLTWTQQNEREAKRIISGLSTPTGQGGVQFKTPVNRNSFLLACLDITEDESIEHLIVGYGDRYSKTTKISAAHHSVGGAATVSMPTHILSQIQHHSTDGFSSEVVIFHNHPKNLLNLLVDNLPLTSDTDRRTASQWNLNPMQFIRTLAKGGRVLFYVGENGFVKPFYLPNAKTILDAFFESRRS